MNSTTIHNIFKGGAFDERRVARCDGAVIVGSSGAGKSCHVDAIRNSRLAKEAVVSFPVRLITRARRMNDDMGENQHVTYEEFEKAKAGGRLAVHWSRMLAGGREQYAFYRPPQESFPIFSANNALLRCYEPQVTAFLQNKLIIGICASDDERRRRLLARSPDLFEERPAEVQMRLDDSSESVPAMVDYVVNTDPSANSTAYSSRIAFLDLITRAVLHPTRL